MSKHKTNYRILYDTFVPVLRTSNVRKLYIELGDYNKPLSTKVWLTLRFLLQAVGVFTVSVLLGVVTKLPLVSALVSFIGFYVLVTMYLTDMVD